MDKCISTKEEREATVQGLLDSCNKMAKILEDERKKIQKGRQKLQAKKNTLANENGGSDVKDSDILDINAGGQVVRVTRGTLTQVKGSRLEALFSGRWEKQLNRDSKGRIFLDVNPICFKIIVDYLNECKIAPPDNPPDLPRTDTENQVFLDALLTAFGLYDHSLVESTILTDPTHTRALIGFLQEDNLDSGLTLLYRGSRDGMNKAFFHQKCDNQGPTITVVKSAGNYIFGGFSDKDWGANNGWTHSGKAFLFGLSCHGGQEPVKMRLNGLYNQNALYCHPNYGPTFGGGHDLRAEGSTAYVSIGNTYASPKGVPYYFTGSSNTVISEIEVFKVTKGRSQQPSLPASSSQNQPLHQLSFDDFPNEIKTCFQAEKEALLEASNQLKLLQESFQRERAMVKVFCPTEGDEIIHLNVSGQTMDVKSSTLGKYPDSVLYKHFVDKNWNGGSKPPSPQDWSPKDVVAWSKKIPKLSENVSSYFRDVTGAELLALEREDIARLGINRAGTIALVAKAIQKLVREDDEKSANFIEHSDYCFGKIIDHMRLKSMSDLDVPDPNPPEIREPDRKRFKRIVEYYFPSAETANEFLS